VLATATPDHTFPGPTPHGGRRGWGCGGGGATFDLQKEGGSGFIFADRTMAEKRDRVGPPQGATDM